MTATAGRLSSIMVDGYRIGGVVDITMSMQRDMHAPHTLSGSDPFVAGGPTNVEFEVDCRWDESDVGQDYIRGMVGAHSRVGVTLDVGDGTRFKCKLATVEEARLHAPLDGVAGLTFIISAQGDNVVRVGGQIQDWIVDGEWHTCVACGEPCKGVSVINHGPMHMNCAHYWGPAGRTGMAPGWHPRDLNRHDRVRHMRMVVEALEAYTLAAGRGDTGWGEHERLTALREEMRAIDEHLGNNEW